MIPEAAVEAAHKAWREQSALDGSIFEYNLRAALEAAAPFILAGVTSDEHIALQLLQAGAQMVDDARLVRNAIGVAK